MKQETGLILGIPVDNLTFDQAIESIFELVDRFARDHQAKYVATVNVDFIVNTVSWLPNRFRHPELITILRKADLVTADGMPVVWAARLLGTRLKDRPVLIRSRDLPRPVPCGVNQSIFWEERETWPGKPQRSSRKNIPTFALPASVPPLSM